MKRERIRSETVTDAERARWVKEYRASGLSLRRFARQHRLNPYQLHYWVYEVPRARLSSPPAPSEPPPVFRELSLPAGSASATAADWASEIGLPNGTTVRLARGTDVVWAMALIDSLRRPCSSH